MLGIRTGVLPLARRAVTRKPRATPATPWGTEDKETPALKGRDNPQSLVAPLQGWSLLNSKTQGVAGVALGFRVTALRAKGKTPVRIPSIA